MKRYILISISICFIHVSYAQIRYEPGYFITNNGDTTHCIIKNVDWKNNPNEFNYKAIASSDVRLGKIDDISEFKILSGAKYKRFTVEVDTSSDQLAKLSTNPYPEYRKENLFLKVLVEGPANLYGFEGRDLTRFFYNKDNGPVKQLIYKTYQVSPSAISKNDGFRKQILVEITCADKITKRSIQKLDYNARDLAKLFNTYNQCVDPSFVNQVEESPNKFFHLRLRPGFSYTFLEIKDATDNSHIDFGSKAGFRIGAEAEWVLHFNKNKWAILFEPVYQYFKSTVVYNNKNAVADYKIIDMGLGARHYFFLDDNSGIFLNAGYAMGVPLGASITGKQGKLELASRGAPRFGAGFFIKKFSLEARYDFPRQVLTNYTFLSSDYHSFSAILGYKLF